jgi:4-hydroxybenzoate polyprenyltransferase
MKNYLILMRIHQWVKNSILFAGIVFSKNLNDPNLLSKSVIAFFLFSLIASSQYVFNDYLDRKEDALHPEKSKRPLASGTIEPSTALFLTVLILVFALVSSYILHPVFFFLVVFYFLFNLTYSKFLKHIVILDVMSISIGFVIRAIAGAVVVNVRFSSWLLLCTFMLSLFWGFSKRRGELILLENNAGSHRKILEEYSVVFLDLMMGISSTMTLMSYVMYTINPETKAHLGTDKMIFTIPIVIYAIFRSLYITYIKNMGHNPTKAILTDTSILLSGLLWFLLISFLMYFDSSLNLFTL